MEHHGKTLSRREIAKVANVVRTCTAVMMCKNIIKHNLLSNGILFSHRRGRIRPDPHMQEIMNDYWLPFCEQMVDSVLIMGLVAVRIVELDDGLHIPVVMEPNSCQISVIEEQGLRSYVLLDAQNEPIPNSLVFDKFGYSPTLAGRLTSPVSVLLPEIEYINMLRGTSVRMEANRADPMLLAEVAETRTSNTEGIQYDYFADGDMQSSDDATKFHRNRTNVQQLAQQQQLYNAFFAGDVNTPTRAGTALENVVTLPIGQKITNTPHHTGRGDVVHQYKMFQDVVCGVLGVPRSLIMSDTPHKSDSEGTHQTFMKTILWWKKNIQQACEHVYNIIYAEDIQKQLLKSMNSKKRKREMGVGAMYALKKRLQVQISFPVTPFMSNDDLYVHYQRGVMPWETYVECAARNASLPFDPTNIPAEPSRKPDAPPQAPPVQGEDDGGSESEEDEDGD